jgi:SOS regulatory protein LexA
MLSNYKNKIQQFYKEYRRMPTYSEIMSMTGFKSKNAVFKLINKLIDEGYVSKDSEGRLIPLKMFGNVTLLSQTVSAGIGAEVQEEVTDTLNIEEWLIDTKNPTYMVEVEGDSMIDAGIFDGDSVLVEKNVSFKDGQVIVALMNDGYTIKFLRKKGDEMWLEPANAKYKPIYPDEDNQIQLVGVVKTVIRKL